MYGNRATSSLSSFLVGEKKELWPCPFSYEHRNRRAKVDCLQTNGQAMSFHMGAGGRSAFSPTKPRRRLERSLSEGCLCEGAFIFMIFFFQRNVNKEDKGQRQAEAVSCTFSRSESRLIAVNSSVLHR